MACLLKIPLNGAKGVVTFTTPEQGVINRNPVMQEALSRLRARFVVGLHFNWHNHQFVPDSRFDFCMAGEGDLISASNVPFRLFPLDACNFTPKIYAPDQTSKFWDVLIAGNPVFFKRPEVVLKTIRALFDESKRKLRVLYICPIPPYRLSDAGTAFYDVRQYYEALFTREERERFTLLTTTFNSPFPFDRETLSVFFRNSRVFLHCATEERRCRIAAYAWSAGLPVVAYPSVASILPESLQAEPGYFRVDRDEDYVPAILHALEVSNDFNSGPYRKVLSESFVVQDFDLRLAELFSEMDLPYSSAPLLAKNLDIRLGWHHHGIGGLSNGLHQTLPDFMHILSSQDFGADQISVRLCEADYPERELAGEYRDQQTGNIREIENRSLYLNPRKLWFRVYRRLATLLRLN